MSAPPLLLPLYATPTSMTTPTMTEKEEENDHPHSHPLLPAVLPPVMLSQLSPPLFLNLSLYIFS